MSYIVPRDKPQECRKCPYINLYNDCKLIWGSERIRTVEEQYQHCPLIEVPTPHGDLADKDKLMKEFMDSDLDHLHRDDWKEVIQIVSDAPTVIEAEE